MRQQVLVLVGLPGAGKTTASSFFCKKSIPVVKMGQVTHKLLQKRGLSTSERNEHDLREYLRNKYGANIYARKVIKKVQKELTKHSVVIVEGVRSKEEIDYFKNNLIDLQIIFIKTAAATRYQRLLRRKIRPLMRNEIKQRDNYEKKLGLPKLESLAEYKVENETSMTEFYTKLSDILNQILN